MALSSLITDFLEYLKLERNASKLTIRNYDHYLKRFLEFVGNIDPKKIDSEMVNQYKAYLSDWIDPQINKKLKTKTQNYFLIALRALLKFLVSKNIPAIPFTEVKLQKDNPNSLQVLEKSELQILLEAPDSSKKNGLRDRAILETLFSTGLRVSELASLNRDTINLDRREFGIVGKGGKERVVFLSDGACERLEKYLAARKDTFKPLFIRFQGRVDPAHNGESMRLTPRSIERIVEKYVKKCGLSIKATPSTLRHSFAKDLLNKGADFQNVQESLGHLNLATTQTTYKNA